MLLSEIGGETGFIERLRLKYGGSAAGLPISIGDDAAVLGTPGGRQVVVTTDMLVEGVHFRRDWSSPYEIGWKSAAVNLSDIAAMGAEPTAAFISLAMPPTETVEWLDSFYRGFVDGLSFGNAVLAGGDTNASLDRLTIGVTQLGTVPTGKAFLRTGARPGDTILVTGALGDFAGGLALLTAFGRDSARQISAELVDAHVQPKPRIAAAKAVAATLKARAAMDISDGLVVDLKKLCAASGVGARILSESLPISDALRAASETLTRDPVDIALDGGEDYELLIAVAPNDLDEVQAAIQATGLAATAVGTIEPSGFQIIGADGKESPVKSRGWDHFAR